MRQDECRGGAKKWYNRLRRAQITIPSPRKTTLDLHGLALQMPGWAWGHNQFVPPSKGLTSVLGAVSTPWRVEALAGPSWPVGCTAPRPPAGGLLGLQCLRPLKMLMGDSLAPLSLFPSVKCKFIPKWPLAPWTAWQGGGGGFGPLGAGGWGALDVMHTGTIIQAPGGTPAGVDREQSRDTTTPPQGDPQIKGKWVESAQMG